MIDGERVRYYKYPDEKYNISVRQMILKNTLTELQSVLPPAFNIEGDVGIDALRGRRQALERRERVLWGENRDGREYQKICQELAAVSFRLGGALLTQYLHGIAGGARVNDEQMVDLYKEGTQSISAAHSIGGFSDLEILGRPPGASFNAQQKLAINIRDIVDVEASVAELITQWYQKIATVKKVMHERSAAVSGETGSVPNGQAFTEFTEACCELADARRNEPEYTEALARAQTKFDNMKSWIVRYSGPKQAADDMLWMAQVREPLTPHVAQTQVVL